MIPLTVTPDLDRDPWTDLRDRIHPDASKPVAGGGHDLPLIRRIGLLRHGTREGRATVAIAVELPDGRIVLAETTLRLWRAVNVALEATPAAAEEPLDD